MQHLQRQVTISLKKGRENWWVKTAEEIEVATALGSSWRLLKLMRDIGGWGTSVSEVIWDKSGEFIFGRERTFDR